MSSATSNQSSIRHFYDLDIWKEANRLSIRVYKITENFPKDEKYGIVDQLKRAFSSVGANIAEGFGRFHYKDKIKFYYNARGSVCEVQNFLFLSQDLKYLEKKETRIIFSEYEQLNKKVNGFIKSVYQKISRN
ncbi:MAG: four helix bundle protein [Candidatus Moranbacteria bacterium]|nr:four helix bundle protein [Candidatus Moranbacteria bacterium]